MTVDFKYNLGDTGFYLVVNKKKKVLLECIVLERHYQESKGINGEDFKTSIAYKVAAKLSDDPGKEYIKTIIAIPEPLLFSNAQDCLKQ